MTTLERVLHIIEVTITNETLPEATKSNLLRSVKSEIQNVKSEIRKAGLDANTGMMSDGSIIQSSVYRLEKSIRTGLLDDTITGQFNDMFGSMKTFGSVENPIDGKSKLEGSLAILEDIARRLADRIAPVQ